MDHVEVLMRLYEAHGEPVTLHELERGARLGPQTVARCATELVGAQLATHDAIARYGVATRPGVSRRRCSWAATVRGCVNGAS